MLIYLKSISLSEGDYETVRDQEHKIQTDIENLKISFLLIEENFKAMEKQFDKKFDRLIDDYRETLNRIYYQKFNTDEEQVTRNDANRPTALYNALEFRFCAEILPKIVFQDFLEFYDEYSYAVNDQIQAVFVSTFFCVQNNAQNINKFRKIYGKKNENYEDYEKPEYLNFNFFLNKLENKLFNIFNIPIAKIRSILYGFNLEDHNIQTTYIQVFYDIILRYKKYGGMKNIEYILSIIILPQELQIYRQNIIDTLYKHISYFFSGHDRLYNYHREVAKTFNVSIRRFAVYEKLLNKYNRYAIFLIDLSNEDTNLFSGIDRLISQNLVTALCKRVFEEVVYESERNICNDYFNDIKALVLETI